MHKKKNKMCEKKAFIREQTREMERKEIKQFNFVK